MVNALKNYFDQWVEGYFYINMIPESRIFGYPESYYLYIIILLFLAVVLIFTGFFFIYYQRKINFYKIFILFITVLWLVTSVYWLTIEFNWLKNDFANFKTKSLEYRRAQMTNTIIANAGLSEQWKGYYEFLEFTRKQVPKNSLFYVVSSSSQDVFLLWATYWLYPDLHAAKSFDTANYILSFNVDLPDELVGFEKFKQFAPNKFIWRSLRVGTTR